MRRQALTHVCATCRFQTRATLLLQRRSIQISATPSTTEPQNQTLDNGEGSARADARFEVLSSPFSLLSASLSASQDLYTRKGTLVGFHGSPDNAVSTLSVLSPLRRAVLGIPFIYQRVRSTTPYTALIATKSPMTSLVVVHLDGRLDWMVVQARALMAWTGHTLSLSPRVNTQMSLAHLGQTSVTGRGLLALSGRGQIHQIALKTGEEYIVHPSNVIAYAMMQHPPQPYRFKTNAFRLQIPNPLSYLPDTRFWRTMRESTIWKFVSNAAFTMRTWSRRVIWGDRLFLHFRGPAQLLIQSRGAALSDVLTTRDVNEIADSPAGAVQQALHTSSKQVDDVKPGSGVTAQSATPTSISYASVSREGKVKFEKGE